MADVALQPSPGDFCIIAFMQNIRWGIIGCGNVTEVKSGPGFQKAENSSLVAVMRRNGDLARDYAQRHGVPRWYDDADRLVHDPEVDAVYIATPPSSHKEYTLKAAQAGKPVYVEKPMAMNFAECDQMLRACQKAGVPLFVAYYRRRLERFLKIKEWLAADRIGEVRFVTVSQFQKSLPEEEGANPPWRVVPEISGGGKFLDVGSHTLDILDFLLGPIERASGSTGNQGGHYQTDDIVNAHFTFQSGVKGTGVWCFSAFSTGDSNCIVGSKGMIQFSTFGTEPTMLTTDAGTEVHHAVHPVHIQQPLIQTIVATLTGQGSCPSTGESGARTTWVMDHILGH